MAHFSFLLKSFFVFTINKKDRGEINEIKTLDDWQLLVINVIIEKSCIWFNWHEAFCTHTEGTRRYSMVFGRVAT